MPRPVRFAKKTRKDSRSVDRSNVANAVSEITRSNLKHNYQIPELVAKMSEKRLIPPRVYEDALWKALRGYVATTLRGSKKNVGTGSSPKLIRRFGCYTFSELSDDGKKVDRRAWKEWEVMTQQQVRDAIQMLYNMAKAMRREADRTLDYCNKLFLNRGKKPFARSDFLS